jgi:hypothetical protein
MKRVSSVQISTGAILEGTAFQGVCITVDGTNALFRDTSGQIVVQNIASDVKPQTRFQIEFNELCTVVAAHTPIVTLLGAVKIAPLRSQVIKPEEVIDCVSLRNVRNIPRGQPFDLLANFTLASTNPKGVKLHLWSAEDGFLTMIVWTTQHV